MFLFTHMGRLSGVGEACAPLRGKQLAELKSITNAYPLGGKLIKLLNGLTYKLSFKRPHLGRLVGDLGTFFVLFVNQKPCFYEK